MDTTKRRRVTTVAALATALVCSTAGAQSFPTRAVRIVVALAPGGGTDNLTRIIAPKLTEFLGQSFVVENRAGAGGQIGSDYVAKAPADGYTILNVDTSFASNPSLFRKLPYDSLKDFAPVSLLASAPVALIIHPSVPAHSLRELLILAKARPTLFNFAMGGYGSATHLGIEQFRATTKIDAVVIPYKGGGPATSDVLAGQVVMMFGGPSSLAQHVATGRLRALAVTGTQSIPALPGVPTFISSGLPAVDAGSYWGSLVPAATPRDVINTLSSAMVRALQMPDVRQRLIALGYEPLGSTPEDFAANLKSEMAKWAKAAKDANFRVD